MENWSAVLCLLMLNQGGSLPVPANIPGTAQHQFFLHSLFTPSSQTHVLNFSVIAPHLYEYTLVFLSSTNAICPGLRVTVDGHSYTAQHCPYSKTCGYML